MMPRGHVYKYKFSRSVYVILCKREISVIRRDVPIVHGSKNPEFIHRGRSFNNVQICGGCYMSRRREVRKKDERLLPTTLWW